MIKGYRDFYYNVKDMDRSIRFYENLGLKKVYAHEHWTTMTLGNLNLGLHWSGGRNIPRTERDSHGQEAGGTLTLLSDSIRQDRIRLEKAGAVILGEIKAPWGHILVFEDPDGNVLKLMDPGG